MRLRRPRYWPTDTRAAIAVQQRLRARVEPRNRVGRVRRVAGLDVGLEADGCTVRAAVVVLSYPELLPLDSAIARRPAAFPYVPGLLSFREIPALLDALAGLRLRPDLILCDGQGIAHPRRFGLACHLGVLLDVASIGVAKSLLIGAHAPVPRRRGTWRPLVDRGERIGAALRTRTGVKPVYVSVGHRIRLDTAINYVLACAPRFRLPETTRAAHRLAST